MENDEFQAKWRLGKLELSQVEGQAVRWLDELVVVDGEHPPQEPLAARLDGRRVSLLRPEGLLSCLKGQAPTERMSGIPDDTLVVRTLAGL
jgi:hypothetical protein